MKMKVSAFVICGLLAVAQNFPGAEQINDPANESFLSSSKESGTVNLEDSLKNRPESIEENSFSENSSIGEMGYRDNASSEIDVETDVGENSDTQSEMGSTVGGPAPKILKVKHTAQYNHARPKTEQGLGDWVFDYPK